MSTLTAQARLLNEEREALIDFSDKLKCELQAIENRLVKLDYLLDSNYAAQESFWPSFDIPEVIINDEVAKAFFSNPTEHKFLYPMSSALATGR